MILVDSSIWVDHFRTRKPLLDELLQRRAVLAHPVVIGELALGTMPKSDRVLNDLLDLPAAVQAEDDDVLQFIRNNALSGSGIGYGDAHLLAATRLTPDATLWTRDRRLQAVAHRMGLDANIEPYAGLQEDQIDFD